MRVDAESERRGVFVHNFFRLIVFADVPSATRFPTALRQRLAPHAVPINALLSSPEHASALQLAQRARAFASITNVQAAGAAPRVLSAEYFVFPGWSADTIPSLAAANRAEVAGSTAVTVDVEAAWRELLGAAVPDAAARARLTRVASDADGAARVVREHAAAAWPTLGAGLARVWPRGVRMAVATTFGPLPAAGERVCGGVACDVVDVLEMRTSDHLLRIVADAYGANAPAVTVLTADAREVPRAVLQRVVCAVRDAASAARDAARRVVVLCRVVRARGAVGAPPPLLFDTAWVRVHCDAAATHDPVEGAAADVVDMLLRSGPAELFRAPSDREDVAGAAPASAFFVSLMTSAMPRILAGVPASVRSALLAQGPAHNGPLSGALVLRTLDAALVEAEAFGGGGTVPAGLALLERAATNAEELVLPRTFQAHVLAQVEALVARALRRVVALCVRAGVAAALEARSTTLTRICDAMLRDAAATPFTADVALDEAVLPPPPAAGALPYPFASLVFDAIEDCGRALSVPEQAARVLRGPLGPFVRDMPPASLPSYAEYAVRRLLGAGPLAASRHVVVRAAVDVSSAPEAGAVAVHGAVRHLEGALRTLAALASLCPAEVTFLVSEPSCGAAEAAVDVVSKRLHYVVYEVLAPPGGVLRGDVSTLARTHAWRTALLRSAAAVQSGLAMLEEEGHDDEGGLRAQLLRVSAFAVVARRAANVAFTQTLGPLLPAMWHGLESCEGVGGRAPMEVQVLEHVADVLHRAILRPAEQRVHELFPWGTMCPVTLDTRQVVPLPCGHPVARSYLPTAVASGCPLCKQAVSADWPARVPADVAASLAGLGAAQTSAASVLAELLLQVLPRAPCPPPLAYASHARRPFCRRACAEQTSCCRPSARCCAGARSARRWCPCGWLFICCCAWRIRSIAYGVLTTCAYTRSPALPTCVGSWRGCWSSMTTRTMS